MPKGMDTERRSRTRTLAALTALLTLAVCLGVPALYYRSRARSHASSDLRVEGGGLIVPDAETGFAPAPRSSTVRRHPRSGLAYHVHTSSRGARVEHAGQETPARVDLLTLGCSFSWGHGVEAEETYTALLARRRSLTAANLAFAAWGTAPSLLALRRNRDLRPRLVVYGLLQDHARRNLMPCAPTYGPACLGVVHVGFDAAGSPRLEDPPPGEVAFHERFARAFFSGQEAGWGGAWLAAEADLRQALFSRSRSFVETPERKTAALRFLVGEMTEAARGAGARLLVVHLPYLERGQTNSPSPAVAAALAEARARGAHALDLSGAVAAHYRDPAAPLLRFERDAHPNAAAHRLFADEIETFALREGLLPAGGES